MKAYDEDAVSAAQKVWRKQDERTWGKQDAASVAERHDALVNLLWAHIPTTDAPTQEDTP